MRQLAARFDHIPQHRYDRPPNTLLMRGAPGRFASKSSAAIRLSTPFLYPILPTYSRRETPSLATRLSAERKLLRVISRSNDEHFCGFDIKDFDDFALLLLMQGENHIE